MTQKEPGSPPMMPDELKKLGELMFGRRWKTAFGKIIRRDRRTIGKYMKLKHQIPSEVAETVRELGRLRGAGKVVFKAIHGPCWRSKPTEIHQAAKRAELDLYAAGLIKDGR